MWSDVLLRAEQLHLLRLLFWGAVSVVVGTALLAVALTQGRGSALIRRFAAVCAGAGAVELVLSAFRYRVLIPRDLSDATRLERTAWLELGLFIGLAAVGATLMLSAGRQGRDAALERSRRLAALGGGIGLALHGLALVVLELLLIADISR